jgi:amino acid transporter
MAVWCQFAMTIFYYPTLLGFVASTLAYVFNPNLADNGVYTGIVILVVFWTGVFVSARGGTRGIAKLASNGLVIGTLIPGALLVVLGVIYLLQGHPSAAPMNASHLLPEWAGIASLVLIVNNFLSYSGMEMNAVHVSSLRNPAKEFPKAMFFASVLVLLVFILPALAISWVVPAQELSLTAGVMQAFSAFFAQFGVSWLVPIVAIALVCASMGGMLTWLAGPSKGLLLIARKEGYLPPFFQEQNENEIPVHILVTQGAVTTVIALLYALVPSVSSAYWILSVMTTQIYLIVYLLMFVAATRLRKLHPEVQRGYTAPALKGLCIMGFVASAAAIVIGFVPPSQFGNSNAVAYALLILAGTGLLGLLPPAIFLWRRKPSWSTKSPEEPPEAPAPPTVPVPPQPAPPSAASAAVASSSAATLGAEPPPPAKGHGRLLVGAGVVVVALVVVGLSTYHAGSSGPEARHKAQQLTQSFEAAGLPVPANQRAITAALGTDGGAVCENPASALGKATLNAVLTNGADFVGLRPVLVDRKILLGELLILQTYCPEQVQPFKDELANLQFASTVKGP